MQDDENGPSAALGSSILVAAYFAVRLTRSSSPALHLGRLIILRAEAVSGRGGGSGTAGRSKRSRCKAGDERIPRRTGKYAAGRQEEPNEAGGQFSTSRHLGGVPT